MYPNASSGIQSDIARTKYNTFIEQLYKDLDKIFSRVAFHPIHRERDNEDRTSIEIVNILRFLHYPAEHEAAYGGNCDVCINKDDEYIWLGEAKIDYNNTHIMEGFRQLVDRYATDKIMRDGGLIIYCKNNAPKDVIDSWRAYLEDKDNKSKEYSLNFDEVGHDYFVTSHYHKSSKKVFTVKHMAVSLFDTASDKSARNKKRCSHSCEKCCPSDRKKIKAKKPA